jgi:type I restriction enzyme S subunit
MAEDNWQSLPFDQAVTINPQVPLHRGKLYPFVDMQAVSPVSKAVGPSEYRAFDGGGSRFAQGDTLMARITPCLENGKIARYCGAADELIAHGSTEFIVIRGRDNVTDNDYAYYLTRWEYIRSFAVSQMSGSSGRQRVPTSALSALDVPVPPLPEQRAIAHILSTLDDKIELNRRMNATLEAMARALFKSWFVDFDPVRAKMEGRDTGLPPDVAARFPDRLVESELGEVPAGWEVGTIGLCAALNPEIWSKSTAPSAIEYVDLSNTKWGRIEATVRYEWADAPSRAQRVLRCGDTIVGTVRPGNGSYALITEDGLTGSTGFAQLRPHRPEYQEFVYLAVTAADSIETLAHLADGAAYPAVRPDVVLATPVVLADFQVMAHFTRITQPLLLATAQNERESRTLAALRDALLPKLLSGEIRVGDLDHGGAQ